MLTVVKQGNKDVQVQSETQCPVCAGTKDEIALSCASLHCDKKIHVSCALRPEGTPLHFCSSACVMDYWQS